MRSHIKSFSAIYDIFSPMVYSIAVQNSGTEKIAEDIVVITFQKLHDENLLQKNQHCIWATLVKLTVQTIKEHLKTNEVVLKQFQNAPILHKILCENITIKDIADQYRISTMQLTKNIRSETNSQRNSGKPVFP